MAVTEGEKRKPEHRVVTRSELRKATISGLRRVKEDPSHLRLTAGQQKHITGKS